MKMVHKPWFSLLAGCLSWAAAASTAHAGHQTQSPASVQACSEDLSSLEAEQLAREMVGRLNLKVKVGQMIQADGLDVVAAMRAGQHPVRDLALGSVLCGGNSIIASDNSVEGWRQTLGGLQAEATASASGLPLLIGIDAMHGHGILHGATVFPHNIGMGATRNPELLSAVAAATAEEVQVTGFNWVFAPAVSVVQDVRWGRSYESYGERAELQQLLTPAFITGLQKPIGRRHIVGTAKHFIGDGGTTWGTGHRSDETGVPGIDRGDTRLSADALIALHGEGYRQAVDAGVDTVMASYSSFNGVKMHENGSLLNEYLKAPKRAGGLGFDGMVVSDWNALDEMPTPGIKDPIAAYKEQIIQSVRAGVDMLMVAEKLPLASGPDSLYRFERAQQLLLQAVADGDVSEQRIDEAVQRILKTKVKAGLFCTEAYGTPQRKKKAPPPTGSRAHRELARTAASQSLVLLKNEHHALPIAAGRYRTLCIAGSKADDYGAQVGAWTVGWQGHLGNGEKVAGANTILDGVRQAAAQAGIRVVYAQNGVFSDADCLTDASTSLTVAVAGEAPYAEYKGDSNDLQLAADEAGMLAQARHNMGPLVLLLVAGRPLILSDLEPRLQGLVMAWLPGSQGEGVADVLFGERDFTGRLPVTWPASMAAVDRKAAQSREAGALYPYGFGLSYE